MKKVFEALYDGHTIQVENRWFAGEKLYVDGDLQDENIGLAIRATLTGSLKNDRNESKNIKVSMGGYFKMNCKLFVDNVLVPTHIIKTRR